MYHLSHMLMQIDPLFNCFSSSFRQGRLTLTQSYPKKKLKNASVLKCTLNNNFSCRIMSFVVTFKIVPRWAFSINKKKCHKTGSIFDQDLLNMLFVKNTKCTKFHCIQNLVHCSGSKNLSLGPCSWWSTKSISLQVKMFIT